MSIIEELFSLQGKVAVVTGAARGNGRAIAKGLNEAGATVIMVDYQHIPELNDCSMYKCDITNTEALSQMIDYVLNFYSKIDILVNNAGVSFGDQSFETYSSENWERTYQVNLKAPFELIQMVTEGMKKEGVGSIINITSLNAELAFPGNPAYIASKGGLRQLTKSAAYDLAKYGIRANNIAPGYMRTAMTEKSYNDPKMHTDRKNRTLLGRWGTSEDLVGAAIFLASDASSYITGQDIYVDGGWSIKGL